MVVIAGLCCGTLGQHVLLVHLNYFSLGIALNLLIRLESKFKI